MLYVIFSDLQQKDILSYYKKIDKIFLSFFGLCSDDIISWNLSAMSNFWIISGLFNIYPKIEVSLKSQVILNPNSSFSTMLWHCHSF